MRARNDSLNQSSVLLVCIYNQYGNIITHDFLYQMFCPYGNIVKILIFEKAKVWKTFIQFRLAYEAQNALRELNNKIVFQDGSKMNIFRSKLRHVEFQNDNLGGVNYEQLLNNQDQQQQANRKRRSTFQDYTSFHSQSQLISSSYLDFIEKDNDLSSTSAKYQSQSFSAKKSKQNSSLNNFMDIDEQFREIALESQEFRQWQECVQHNRRKSKTIVNPNSQQFLLQNIPSKVLFARSLPKNYDNDVVYNIFSNFGKVTKVIFIQDKSSALIQFDNQMNAIQAKDEINYAKAPFKVFYSHYQTLVLRKLSEDQQQRQYHSEYQNRGTNFNPPSQILYLTMANPKQEQEIIYHCSEIGCKILDLQWRQNSKDRWMCLIQFNNLQQSLYAMGCLQNIQLKNGRRIRLSFTRSRISNKNNYYPLS